MKKILVVCAIALMCVFNSTNSNAQQIKIGVFDEQAILGLMPGIQKVDTLLNKYATEDLAAERDHEISEFKRKDSTFRADSAKMNSSLKGIMQKEIADHFYKIQNWQQYQEQMLRQKQSEYLKPFYDKIGAAFQEVVAEQKYTHIFKQESVIIAEKSEDLSLRVLAKMKIPLPKEIEDQMKAAGIPYGGGSGAATKPTGTAKPPVKH